MGKYYKASTMPIIDYGFKLPFEELFTVVKYKQDRYDEALSKMQEAIIASGDLNAIPTSDDEAYITQVRNQLKGLTTKYQNTDLALNYGKIMADINGIAADPKLIESQKSYAGFANDMKNYMTQANAGINDPNQDPRLQAKGYSTAEQGIWSKAPMPYTSPDATFKSIFDSAGEEYKNLAGLGYIAKDNAVLFGGSPEGIQAMQKYLQNNPSLVGNYGPLDQLGLPTDKTQREDLAIEVLKDGMKRFLDIPGSGSSSSSGVGDQGVTDSQLAIAMQTAQTDWATFDPEGIGNLLGVEAIDHGNIKAYPVQISDNIRLTAGTFDMTTYDLNNNDGTLKKIDKTVATDQQEIEWAQQWSMAKQFFGSNEYQTYQSLSLDIDDMSRQQKAVLEGQVKDVDNLTDAEKEEITKRFELLQDTYSNLGMWTDQGGAQYENLKKAYEDWLTSIEDDPNNLDIQDRFTGSGLMEQATAYAMQHFPTTMAKFVPIEGKGTIIDGKLQLKGFYDIPEAAVKSYFEGLQEHDDTGVITWNPNDLPDHEFIFGMRDVTEAIKKGFGIWGEGGWRYETDWDNALRDDPNWEQVLIDEGGDKQSKYWRVGGYKEVDVNLENAIAYDQAVSGGAKLTDLTSQVNAYLAHSYINQVAGEERLANSQFGKVMAHNKSFFTPRTSNTRFNGAFTTMDQDIARMGVNLNSGMTTILTDFLNEKQTKGMGKLSNDEISQLGRLKTILANASTKNLTKAGNQTNGAEVKTALFNQINNDLRTFYHDQVYQKEHPYTDVSSYKTSVPKLAEAYGLTKVETSDYSNLKIDSKVYAPYASENFKNTLTKINEIAQKRNLKLKVTGMFRSPEYNDQLPDAKKSDYYYRNNPNVTPDVSSFHTNGNAIDIGLQTTGGKEISSLRGFLAELENLGLNIVKESDHYHISL